MRSSKIICFLIWLQAAVVSAQAISLEDLLGSGLNIPENQRPIIARIVSSVGGRKEFEAELRNVVNEASLFRGCIPASFVHFTLSRTIVAKICFSDGICWAAKILESFTLPTAYGIEALRLVHEFCPDIPIAEHRGCGWKKLMYCYTDWKEGKTLEEEVLGTDINLRQGENIKISEKLVTSLATFVYNLTSCPIPKNMLVKNQLDNLSSFGHVTRNETELESMNAETWAKRQFVAWQLFHLGTEPSTKPYDGLDKILLLSWIRRKFSGLDRRVQPFVLHYWDLRMPNIIIDEDNNLIAIIDWDGVTAVPLISSAIALGEFDPRFKRDRHFAESFQHELGRIELEKSSSMEWSSMFLDSIENKFFFEILRPRETGYQLVDLRRKFPKIMAEAVHRSPETLKMAASEWEEFAKEFFADRGLPVPDWPQYVEIQEGLGIYGRSALERKVRRLKRTAVRWLWDRLYIF